jgi:uncharacterized RDD family membrane protein YckC
MSIIESNMVSSDERRGGERKEPRQIILANWRDRFLAWIVDFILVSIALAVLFSAIAIPIWFFFYYDDMTAAARAYQNVQPSHYIISSLAFFGYWTYFEYTSGQSIGKRLLKIKTIDLSGDNRIDIKSAAIESFGKAFLLPIDVILGWIFTNNKRQRIFNRISNTIVIKLKKPQHIPEDNIRYTKD